MTGGIVDFIGFVMRRGGGRGATALALLLLASLFEGVSILLLIPLLQFADGAAGGVPIAGLPLASHLFDPGTRLSLAPLLGCFLAFVAAQAILNRAKTVHLARMMQLCVDTMRLRLFRAIGGARWTLVAATRGADLQQALTGDVERVRAAVHNLLLLLQAVVMMAIYAALAAVISPAMTLFAIGMGGAVLLALYPVRRRATRFGETLGGSLADQQHMISEFLSGMKVAKAFNAEARYVARLEAMLRDVRREMVCFARATASGTLAFQLVGAGAAVGFIYVSVAMLHLPLARIAVLLFVFVRIAPRFNMIQDSLQQLLSHLPAYLRTQRLIERFEAGREKAEGAGLAVVPPLRREIRFERVGMDHGGGGPPVLRDVSFAIPAGRITAIAGPSGSGKTTLADMLMGLVEPSAGRVLLDGRPLDGCGLRAWRERVAYVPQDGFLLNDSIAANLAVAAPDADARRMWRALEASGAAAFVARMPAGLDTVVADRGIRLSGGERQRIALARALLRRPDLLILDEATSALDENNEELIIRSLERLRGAMTILVIAHRARINAIADQVVLIEQGQVRVCGPDDRDGVLLFPPKRADRAPLVAAAGPGSGGE
ncbi:MULTISPECIES: ABC transporter ATP-binding protein [unclassified Sphingomonas]|uniref:ABC transporter ATP-binding protein n=1 Tax=unclassified Sphingomonas TaxID=196159 RepID=UPI0006FD4D9E|nr:MULTISPECIES: ABC transporter ATP-binding protein [unclassified Sphingomonas]KQX18099.1 ABC transporter [Sphingomonas sp. Root1294]KQY72654.1 ABC transporter [Sphingomonas sp. Root50]KRB87721.1 ABC transporter [Sphingomonas sp. Root720]